MEPELYLVRYGELGLKSTKIRKRMESVLIKNIQLFHLREGLECLVDREWGRIFVHTSDHAATRSILDRVFGITSYSPAWRCEARMESMEKLALKVFEPLAFEGCGFAVRARRNYNEAFNSQELERDMGSYLWEHVDGLHVDLTKPDVTLRLEVRGKDCYVFSEKNPGPGGMPLGTQGSGMVMVKEDKDLAAAWLMMKRGCRVYPVDMGGNWQELEKWDPELRCLKEGEAEGWHANCRISSMTSAEFQASPPEKGEELVFYPLIGLSLEQIDELVEKVKMGGEKKMIL